jgi:hypothetical protein
MQGTFQAVIGVAITFSPLILPLCLLFVVKISRKKRKKTGKQVFEKCILKKAGQ